MGDQSCIIFNMKFFVVASALVAAAYGAADAEADAALLYGAYGYGLPLAYGAKSAPCVNAANVPVPCAGGAYGYAGWPYAYGGHYLGKREADAAVLYGAYGYPYAGLGYGYGYGLGYAALPTVGIPNPVHAVAATPAGLTHSSNVGICTNYLGASVPCGRKKREAEADPALLYGAYGYPSYAYGLYGGVAATDAALGHAVAYTGFGAVHSSHVGV